jgi:hypothetical protein
MQVVKYVVMAILFAILSPGVLIWLPIGASRRVAALVHGIVFAAVWYLIHGFVERIEGYEDKKEKH